MVGSPETTCAIRTKRRIHKNGPGVYPWPGPKSGVVEEFSYDVGSMPWAVFM